MTSDRPYREARPLDVALVELRRCAGTQFDPEVVEAVAGGLTGGGAPARAQQQRRRALATSRDD